MRKPKFLRLVQEAIKYRSVVQNFVRTSLLVRYKKSILGYFWTVLNPIFRYSIIGFVFEALGKFNMPHYYGFMFIGSIVFGYMTSTIVGATNALVSNEGYIKKIYVPKMIFIFNHVFFETFNFFLVFLGVGGLLLFMGEVSLSWSWLVLPLSLFVTLLFLVGISTLMAVTNVFFRDLQHLSDLFFQALYFLTPIMYPITILLNKPIWGQVALWNPLYHYVEIFRLPIVYNEVPHIQSFILTGGISIAVVWLGLLLLSGKENRILYKL